MRVIRYDTIRVVKQRSVLLCGLNAAVISRSVSRLLSRAGGRPAGGRRRAGGPRAANGMDRTALHCAGRLGTRRQGVELS